MHHQPYFVFQRTAAFCVAAVLLTTLSASADTLWLVDDNEPRFGRVVRRQDNDDLVFKLRGEDNTYSELTFAAEKIETLVVNIDVARLEHLDRGNLNQYHEYAEELAEQKLDPEARDLAIRLYLITAAAANRRHDLGLVESALTGLPELARNEQEREAFDRLLTLYARNPRSESTRLASKKQDPVASTDDRARQQLLQAIRLIRREDNASAIKILNTPDVLAELGKWSELVSAGDIRLMTGSTRLSLPQLRKMLTLEIALQDFKNQPQRSNQPLSWSEQAQEPMSGWTQLPSFENVTEFDPDKSVFRNGQWVKPVAVDSTD